MKLWIKYGLFNSIIGLLIGGYTAISAIGDGYFVFAIAAPVAVFLTAGFFWKIFVNEKKNLALEE